MATPTQHDNELAVVTVATKPDAYFKVLLQSCQRHGIQPVVLGMGSPWRGFCMKFNLVYHYITQVNSLPYTLFVDGYDCIFQSGITEILKTYQDLNPFLVVAADVYCYPDSSLTYRYLHSSSKARFVNSGGYIGSTKTLVRILESMGCPFKDENQDDQLKLSHYFLSSPSDVRIDYNSQIFHCLCGAEDAIQFKDRAYVVRSSGKKPHILHLNGHIQGDPYFKNLGYTLR